MWQLKRNQQLWTFSTPLVSRLVLFVLGLLIWYWNRSIPTDLRTWALLLAHASLVDFLLDGCPLWPVDGYVFMLAFFRLPPNFLERVSLVWEMVLSRRPVPNSLSSREKLGLQIYGIAALVFWLFMVVALAFLMARELATDFVGIFGRGTGAIILVLILVAALRQPVAFFKKTFSKKGTSEKSSLQEQSVLDRETLIRHRKPKYWRKKWIKLLILVVFGALLFLPYPYRPGGQIQLLPPTQQAIQAQVDGKIIKVMFKGGDGQWIKAGTPIAQMEAVDIENDVLTQQEQIKNQQAIVEKQQANLNKLLATPRKEDVEVARQQVEVAKQDVEVARQEVEVAKQDVEVAKKKLATAISKADFSAKEALRFEGLYKEGVVSRQVFEDKKRQAETERLTVEENRQDVAAKQQEVESNRSELATKQQAVAQRQANLELVLSGPYPDDIQASRREIEAAKAALKRQQQQLKYDREQLQRTQLLMPIDGYLVTSYLDQKVGSYLKQGNTFAVAEDDRNIRGEVRVAEYNIGEFNLGASVELKLLAYPNRPFMAKVVSIEPAASNPNSSSTTVKEPTGIIKDRFVKVIVEMPNTEKLFKSSMTGYAKITGSPKPVIVAFTRPIVRFIQIEIWSWLP
ncbi:MAG TPA: efflux RND transporter periplasmic adaptor subunit [Oculatellaceae cyanobacterium]